MSSSAIETLRDTLLDYQVSGEDHIWAVPLLAALPVSAGRLNFDGLAGDTFFNNPFYGLPRTLWGQWRPDADVVAAIAPGHREWDRVWDGLVSRPLADRLVDALNALPEGPARLSLFYLLGRTRRVPAILPYGMLDLRIDSVCPYVDYDVMDHAWTFDPVLKGALRLQRVALDRHFPEFDPPALVAFAARGSPAPLSGGHGLREARGAPALHGAAARHPGPGRRQPRAAGALSPRPRLCRPQRVSAPAPRGGLAGGPAARSASRPGCRGLAGSYRAGPAAARPRSRTGLAPAPARRRPAALGRRAGRGGQRSRRRVPIAASSTSTRGSQKVMPIARSIVAAPSSSARAASARAVFR